MAADLSAIDNRLLEVLGSDPTLAALLPDGAWFDPAPAGLSAFLVLNRPPEMERANALGDADGWERVQYTVKSVIESSSRGPSNDAAHRIHELLHRGLRETEAGGYRVMHLESLFAITYGERDPTNTAIVYQHNGGQYQVMLCPAE
jgi:hypothetical protein